MLDINKKYNYVVCEDFNGERRIKTSIFTNKHNAEEALNRWINVYDKLLTEKQGKEWIKLHKISKPYLVEISFKKVK